jgi:hypothetical protein
VKQREFMIENIQHTSQPDCAYAPCRPRSGGEQRPAANRTGNEDTVRISDEARKQANGLAARSAVTGAGDLSPEQKREVEQLKKRDQEVKAHERAHMAAGSGVVIGGANYEYQRGPDGKMYAVGGEVKIDTSRENEPAQTIRKMQQVKRAALAPAQPSAQDRRVAAQASQVEAEARIELAKANAEASKAEDASDRAPGSVLTVATSPASPTSYNRDLRGSNINITV